MTFEAGWNAAIEKAAKAVLAEKATWHTVTGNPCTRLAAAIRSLTLPSDLVAVPREPTPEEMKEVAKAIGNTLASMHGGCFNPNEDPDGECADGDCYCSRMCDRTASAAITTYRAMLAAHKEG